MAIISVLIGYFALLPFLCSHFNQLYQILETRHDKNNKTLYSSKNRLTVKVCDCEYNNLERDVAISMLLKVAKFKLKYLI